MTQGSKLVTKTKAHMHIAVVDPGGRVPELDNYNRLVLRNPEVRLSYHLPALFGMSSLELIEEKPEAMIIFGSSASVNEGLPWQPSFHSWIKKQMDSGLPTLGICYGHQLIAHLYGGTVDFALPSQEKYKGLREINLEKTGFWQGNAGRFVVSHREVVTSLSCELEKCGGSSEAEFELIRHRMHPIWGIQSHPEAGPEFIINSAIPLKDNEHEPFKSGDDFMRRFILHMIELRKAS